MYVISLYSLLYIFLFSAKKTTVEPIEDDELKPSCKANADIGFVIDRSSTTDEATQNHFLKTLAFSVGVTSYVTHPSVISFGNDAKSNLKFSDHGNLYQIYDTLEELPLMGNQRRIDKGLRLAQKEMFKKRNGVRMDVPRVLVLVTNGPPSDVSDAEDPVMIVGQLRERGIKIVIVNTAPRNLENDVDFSVAGDGISTHSVVSVNELLSPEYIRFLTTDICSIGKQH